MYDTRHLRVPDYVRAHPALTGHRPHRRRGGPTPARQSISREQALELYTLGGARLTGEEEHKAVLGEGRFADFAVLSHDYFAVPVDDIPHIESPLIDLVLIGVAAKLRWQGGRRRTAARARCRASQARGRDAT
ncbi:amidohydrolase family protein [Streptomyces sp. NPDC093089]|uniref:amidohydrolase family protein n=1 Tax=Streptomyces sp. NPDC093089 TaxID=3366024 RepID=UPI00380F7682